MSIELKPCPWCGAPAERRIGDTGSTNAYRKWVECTVCTCRTSVHLTEDADDRPADDAWNALPRALVWTTEQPAEPGFYYAEHIYGDNREYIDVRVIEAIDRTHWIYRDWEKRRGNPGCLLAIGYGVGLIAAYSRFAGPIPTPQEPAL